MRLDENQLAEFEERGFLFFPSLLSPAEVTVMANAVTGLMSRTGPEVIPEDDDSATIKMVFGAHLYDPTFEALSRHPSLLIPSEQLMRSKVHVFQSRFTPKTGFGGGGWCWHQDFNQWYRQDGMLLPHALMVAVFIDDINACNAPLMLIPESHKRGHLVNMTGMAIDLAIVRELAERHGIEALMGPAGSVAFVSCLMVHGSGPNMSPFTRRVFYFNYNSVENKSLQPLREVHHCSADFTPLAPAGPECLSQFAEASQLGSEDYTRKRCQEA